MTVLLWLGLALCVPVPFALVESGREPVAALVHKMAVMLQLVADEGGAGAASMVVWILLAQAAVAMAALGAAAWTAVHILDRLLGRHSPVAVFSLLALMIAVATAFPLYRTPFRTGGTEATLTQVFE